MQIDEIQRYLREHDLDGWLMADFHGRNDIAVDLLQVTGMLTRRAFYFIPAEGEPVALINPIDAAKWQHTPGRHINYQGYAGLERHLRETLQGRKTVAMEYSPSGRLPYIGLVDAGSIELVRSMELDIVSSADLVAHFLAKLSPEQIASHRIAARNVMEIKDAAFALIAEKLAAGERITEWDVKQFILDKFEQYDMETDHAPAVCVDGNAGDPHYEATAENHDEITRGRLILIDLWAKIKGERTVFGDITWMAYAGTRSEIPERYVELFEIVLNARDAAIAFLREHVGKRPVMGYEVDDACRQVMIDAGHADYFVHRTGHSIAGSVHGPGPNIDNLETEDSRELQVGHLFSIEPGLYFDDCGFRSELDCLITPDGIELNPTPLQQEIKALF